jgi:hypothetical protein
MRHSSGENVKKAGKPLMVKDRQMTFSQVSLRLNALTILLCETLVAHFTHY